MKNTTPLGLTYDKVTNSYIFKDCISKYIPVNFALNRLHY